MITTDFVHGSPCWLDLGAPDVRSTAAFYGNVMGWHFDPSSESPEDYGAFTVDGQIVAAIGKLTESGARSAWMLYFTVPDADTAVAETARLGGSVRAGAMDAGEMGRMAQLTDPQGGQFAVWQPGKNSGFDRADSPGALCWTELYTTDAAGAKSFYGDLFGWTYADMPMPGDQSGTYTTITPAAQDEQRMHGGLMELPAQALEATGGKAYWHPVFAVTDPDGAVAKVREGGGGVRMGPEDAPGVGRLALCTDPDGADFVVLRPEG